METYQTTERPASNFYERSVRRYVESDPGGASIIRDRPMLCAKLAEAHAAGNADGIAMYERAIAHLDESMRRIEQRARAEYFAQRALEERLELEAARMFRTRRDLARRVTAPRQPQARRQRRTRVVRGASSAKSTADPEPASSHGKIVSIGTISLGGAA